jgi:hypothetical protein
MPGFPLELAGKIDASDTFLSVFDAIQPSQAPVGVDYLYLQLAEPR